MVFDFTVSFVKGKARPRFSRGHTYTPKSTLDAEKAIAKAFSECPGACKAPANVPVELQIAIAKRLPAQRPKSIIRETDTTKPDLDNVAKLIMDGLNGVAYEDDKQVTRLLVWRACRINKPVDEMFVRIKWDESN